MILRCGPLAQLVEHLTLNQGVLGSNPRWPTIPKSKLETASAVFLFCPQPKIRLSIGQSRAGRSGSWKIRARLKPILTRYRLLAWGARHGGAQ